MRRALLALAFAIGASACSADQDPGIAPDSSEGTVTTSHTLSPCPPGGPDATTPAAGCVDEDGVVVRP